METATLNAETPNPAQALRPQKHSTPARTFRMLSQNKTAGNTHKSLTNSLNQSMHLTCLYLENKRRSRRKEVLGESALKSLKQ